MSAVAAAAVGPTPVMPPPPVPSTYVMCGGGGGVCGARKRKDVVQDVAAAAAAVEQDGVHGLFVLETVEEEKEHEAEAGVERERSSIGAASGEEEEDDEVDSEETCRRRRKKGGGLTCLDALDDALPIKRGLSSFFSGKSRSFANLQDVQAGAATSAKDVLAKPENPFNKRRRILRCSSIRRVSSTSLTALPPFLPPPAGPGRRPPTTHETTAPVPAAVADQEHERRHKGDLDRSMELELEAARSMHAGSRELVGVLDALTCERQGSREHQNVYGLLNYYTIEFMLLCTSHRSEREGG